MADFSIDRRGFIKSATLLSVAFSVAPVAALAPKRAAVLTPNALLRIEADNTVRIFMPHADLGSGIYTGLAQILADELDADWSTIVTEHLNSLDPAFQHTAWGVIATGASTSVNNQWLNLRRTGATARAMLVQAAAERWGVAAATLTAADSVVYDRGAGRQASYGELSAHAAGLDVPTEVTLKTPEQFRLIGRNLKRLDSTDKSNGTATFGIDVQLPDMLYAAIAHPPVFGGRVNTVAAERAQAMPGVRRVVEIATGVAVVADSYWRAKKAKDALEIRWDDGAFAETSSADLWRQYAELGNQPGQSVAKRGTVAMEQAASRIDGEIRFPFLAHAPMEPLNATARISGDRCEIWTGTQFQGIDVANLEAATGIAADRITIHSQWLGGSFGRRAAPHGDYLVEAVQIAQAAGLANPIKMIWQREDDIQGGLYRPMALHRYAVGVDAEGLPAHWQHRVVCASINKGTPLEAAFYSEGFDRVSVEGLINTHYAAANIDFQLHTTAHAVPVCWLRGEGDSHNGPAVEAIINRLARHTNSDPFAYRHRLLADNDDAARIRGVLQTLEQASGWSEPPAADVFRGMAVHPSFGSVCGYVVELKKTGQRLDFHKVTAAFDCGRVINPDSVKAQVYSAVAFALSTLIGQKIEIAGGAAVQSNFHDYTVAALHQVPTVDVHLVDNGLEYPTGVGEVGVSPFIPAVTEAVFAATGEEINAFPMVLRDYTFLSS